LGMREPRQAARRASYGSTGEGATRLSVVRKKYRKNFPKK